MKTIYESLDQLLQPVGGLKAFTENEEGYLKLKSGPYMDLVIERISGNNISMSHYYEQNGDLVPDPDMTIKIDHEKKIANSLSFQDMFKYQQVYEDTADGFILNEKLQAELNEFLTMWLKNLNDQGFNTPVEVITEA